MARQIVRAKKQSRAARIVALYGNLGSGKTTFVQGFMRGLGVRARMASPTFIIMRRVSLRRARFRSAYHVDAYRLRGPRRARSLGLEALIENPLNIILIEWPENIRSLIPKSAIRIRFFHGQKENERIISVSAPVRKKFTRAFTILAKTKSGMIRT